MKLLHLSDLHLGKRLGGCSLLEDQAYILDQILSIADREGPDALVIAGDVYDKGVPPAEAVALFDDFLSRVAARGLPAFIISGNHDSPERLAFANRLIRGSGVYLAPVYDGAVAPITLTDQYGPVHFYLLPFLKPAHVRRFCPEATIETWTAALAAALSRLDLDPAARNVLVAHQFVTGAARSESEELSVGGADNVDAAVFDSFDYVALGHIHRPQTAGRDGLRYCGSPLKYAFSEGEKSVTLAHLGEKGNLTVRTVPLTPLRDMREIRGTYLEVTARSFYQGTNTQDYLHITLTDEEDVPEAVGKLRVIYPNLLRLDYDNTRTRQDQAVDGGAGETASPLELFTDLYEKQNNQPMTEAQTAFARRLMEEIWEGEP